jgi:uncharacterized protein YjbI with pentapeptide repeats
MAKEFGGILAQCPPRLSSIRLTTANISRNSRPVKRPGTAGARKPPSWEPMMLEGWNFQGVRFNGAAFQSGHLVEVDFSDSSLDTVVFRDCRLERCNLRGAKLEDATFVRCEFIDCDLTDSKLAGIKCEKGLAFTSGARMARTA